MGSPDHRPGPVGNTEGSMPALFSKSAFWMGTDLTIQKGRRWEMAHDAEAIPRRIPAASGRHWPRKPGRFPGGFGLAGSGVDCSSRGNGIGSASGRGPWMDWSAAGAWNSRLMYRRYSLRNSGSDRRTASSSETSSGEAGSARSFSRRSKRGSFRFMAVLRERGRCVCSP